MKLSFTPWKPRPILNVLSSGPTLGPFSLVSMKTIKTPWSLSVVKDLLGSQMEVLDSLPRKMPMWVHTHTETTTINLKWIKYQNLRAKTVEVLGKKHRGKIFITLAWPWFLGYDAKGTHHRRESRQVGHYPNQMWCFKGHHRVEGHPTEWE